MLVGGSRSGKTFVLCRTVLARAHAAPESRHVILRFRGNAARSSISLDTLPRAAKLCFPGKRLTEYRQDGFFELVNGSQIWVSGLDDQVRAEKILGQEFATIYFNECSQIPYSSVTLARTRLAQVVPHLNGGYLTQRAYYDLNPPGKGHWTYQMFVAGVEPDSRQPIADRSQYASLYMNPHDNAANLSPEYLAELASLPERARKRFLDGEYQTEIDGALWTLETLEQGRVENVPDLQRVVVGVDPSGASGDENSRSDAIGIVVAGKGVDGRGYVLEDLTCRLSPEAWARRAVDAYRRHSADCIVAEKNFGGDMVRAVLRAVDADVPIRLVTASRGKAVRAEPIAALYEQSKVSHVGMFVELEDEMLNFSVSGYQGSKSPNRADALVWVLTELMGKTIAEVPIVVPMILTTPRGDQRPTAKPTLSR
jgi:hypothetical protein